MGVAAPLLQPGLLLQKVQIASVRHRQREILALQELPEIVPKARRNAPVAAHSSLLSSRLTGLEAPAKTTGELRLHPDQEALQGAHPGNPQVMLRTETDLGTRAETRRYYPKLAQLAARDKERASRRVLRKVLARAPVNLRKQMRDLPELLSL